jgi:hypothetical protein
MQRRRRARRGGSLGLGGQLLPLLHCADEQSREPGPRARDDSRRRSNKGFSASPPQPDCRSWRPKTEEKKPRSPAPQPSEGMVDQEFEMGLGFGKTNESLGLGDDDTEQRHRVTD